MNRLPYLMVLLLMILAGAAQAEEVTKGFLHEVSTTRLAVELKSGAIRRFIAADGIRVMSESGQLTLKDIPKHSKVQVIERNGLAELVIIEEMPR